MAKTHSVRKTPKKTSRPRRRLSAGEKALLARYASIKLAEGGVFDQSQLQPPVATQSTAAAYQASQPPVPAQSARQDPVADIQRQQDAFNALSNTERYKLANPTNAPYSGAGPAPGSSAQVSAVNAQFDAQKSLARLGGAPASATTPAPKPASVAPASASVWTTPAAPPNFLSGLLPMATVSRQGRAGRVNGFADGAVLSADDPRETAEQLLARMNAKYGLGGAGTSPVPETAQEKPQAAIPPVQIPSPPPTSSLWGTLGSLVGSIKGRTEQANKATNYSCGGVLRKGYAHGAVLPVRGEGTGTSDSVPAVVSGKHVNLSNGEGVAILPAKTMRTPGVPALLESLIETTNGRPSRTAGIREGGGYANGYMPDVPNQTDQDTRENALTQAASAQPGGLLSSIAAKIAAKDVPLGGYLFNENMRKETPSAPLPEWAARLTPTYAAAVNSTDDPVEQQSRGERVLAELTEPQRASPPVGTAAFRPYVSSADADRRIEATQADKSSRENTGNAGNAKSVPNYGGATGVGAVSFTQPGIDVTKLDMAPGSGVMSNTKSGNTLVVGDMSPNRYIAADGTPNSPWEKTQQYADAQAEQARMKKVVRGGFLRNLLAGDLESAAHLAVDPEDHALLGAAYGRQRGLDRTGNSLSDLSLLASLGNAQTAQTIGQAQARTALDSAQLNLDQQKRLATLANAYMVAKTPEEKNRLAEQLHIVGGNDNKRFTAVMGKDEMNNPTIAGVLDTHTGNLVDRYGAANRYPTAPTDKSKLKVGETYALPSGVSATWNGTHFIPVAK